MTGDTALIVSTTLLWTLVLVLAAAVLALARQIGVLHARIAPVGALALPHGPAVGDAAPHLVLETLDGQTLEIGTPTTDGASTLIFFLSPTCPVCRELLPALRSLRRAERARLQIVLASDGLAEDHAAYVRSQDLGSFPYVVSTALGLAFRVPRLPWAVLLDPAGRVRSKGLVNTREHLESLLEADERGLATLQDWAAVAAANGELP